MAEIVKISRFLDDFLSIVQLTIGAFTLLGTLLLSIEGKPAAAFAAVGLGSLLLVRFGDIASLSLKAFGVEAIINRVQEAESDALKAAKEAKQAVAEAEKTIEALKQTGLQLSSAVLPLVLELEPLEAFREVFGPTKAAIRQRDAIKQRLTAMGCTPEQIAEALQPFDARTIVDTIRKTARELRFTVYQSELEIRVEDKNYSSERLVQYVVQSREEYGFGDFRDVPQAEFEEWIREIANLQSVGSIDFKKFEKLPKPN